MSPPVPGAVMPPTADQVYAALVALGVDAVIDPDHRPDGLRESDRAALLGALLASVELAVVAEPAEAMVDVAAWYQQALGVDGSAGGDGGVRLLLALLRRSALLRGQLMAVVGLDGATGSSVVHAAGATAGLLQLLILTDAPAAGDADPDGARLLREVVKAVRTDLRAGRQAFEGLRRDLAGRGYRL